MIVEDCGAVVLVTSADLTYCGREVRSYLCARGAYHITLLHQRVERPGLDGLIEQKISDQTVQVWLIRWSNWGTVMGYAPRAQRYDLTSHPQYFTPFLSDIFEFCRVCLSCVIFIHHELSSCTNKLSV